jgi:hypothetical protein
MNISNLKVSKFGGKLKIVQGVSCNFSSLTNFKYNQQYFFHL